MKLDRIKLASLVAYIVGLRPEHKIDINQLDSLTEINVEPVSTQFVEAAKVDELLAALNTDKLIEAIKAYRSLTGAGLKESKEAVEKYRNVRSSNLTDQMRNFAKLKEY